MKRTLLAALLMPCSLPQSAHPQVAGLAQPILNGPLADQSISKQE